jgi:hypothetical protein
MAAAAMEAGTLRRDTSILGGPKFQFNRARAPVLVIERPEAYGYPASNDMASRSIHVADFSRALADGTFPGEFNAERTIYAFPPVESLNSRGARLVWQISVRLVGAGGAALPFAAEILSPGSDAPAGSTGVISTESHQVSAAGVVGKTRAGGKPTEIRSGKNLGKTNATNVATQALRDAFSRHNAHAKKAAPHAAAATAAAAAAAATPAARTDQPPPMLVKKIGETREATLGPEDFGRGVTLQRKYNGVRAPTYLRGAPGKEVAQMYSRTKGDYPGFTHLREEMACNLIAPPTVPDELLQPPGGCGLPLLGETELARLRAVYADARVHLDGEIYLHGKGLRYISGQARKEDDEKSLDYYVYDCFFPAAKAADHDMASAHRQKYLDLFFAAAAAGGPERKLVHVRRAENFPAASLEEAEALRDRFLQEGYEGAIARKDCAGYRYSFNNYHSANLVKLKPKYDSEFEVVAYTEGVKGKDVGAVIWICEVDAENMKAPSDKTFNVVPKNMTYEERYRIFRCLGEEVDDDRKGAAPGARATRFDRDFRGQPLTVEYPERSTKTGKPTQAKALAFRTYEDGPAHDPVRRLYTECAEKRAEA